MTTYQILVFMKKMFYCLTCLLGLSACSSENIALDAMKGYDVANSTCKVTLSPTETRPDFYLENSMGPVSLGMELGKDGVVRCTLEDVEANCAVRKIHVDIAHQGNQIVLVVYQVDVLFGHKGVLVRTEGLYDVRSFKHLMRRIGMSMSECN